MNLIERRSVLRAGAALGTVAALSPLTPARAAAPLAGKQPPAFYRLKVGEYEVTVVSDGHAAFPAADLYSTAPPADLKAVLDAEFRSGTPMIAQLNTIVVNTGDKLLLLDTGTGGKFQNTSGALIANLAAAGYTPDQVDIVAFTHGHPDHLWGVSDPTNSKLLFPNAEFVTTDTEFGFWSAPDLGSKMPEGMRPMIDATQTNLKLIAPKLRQIRPGADIVTGITSVSTPGHTPGHTSILIASGNAALLVSADVVHNAAISFHHPEWPIGFDMDKDLGGKTRAAFLDRAATDRTLIVSYHLPFPGVGHVARDGNAYRWVPAEWTAG